MKKSSPRNLTEKEQNAVSAFSRQVKKELGSQLVSMKLFGSKVRGDFRQGSDIDIYIVIKSNSLKVREKIAEIDAVVWDEYEVSLSPVVYSSYEEERNLSMHSFFFEAVQREGISL